MDQSAVHGYNDSHDYTRNFAYRDSAYASNVGRFPDSQRRFDPSPYETTHVQLPPISSLGFSRITSQPSLFIEQMSVRDRLQHSYDQNQVSDAWSTSPFPAQPTPSPHRSHLATYSTNYIEQSHYPTPSSYSSPYSLAPVPPYSHEPVLNDSYRIRSTIPEPDRLQFDHEATIRRPSSRSDFDILAPVRKPSPKLLDAVSKLPSPVQVYNECTLEPKAEPAVTTPAASPEETASQSIDSAAASDTLYYVLRSTKTTPYSSTETAKTCPRLNVSRFHAAQKAFISSLYLKDSPSQCLSSFHKLASDTKGTDDAVTMSQLINAPVLHSNEAALHIAVKWCKPNTVNALIRLGANPRLRTGHTCAKFPCHDQNCASSTVSTPLVPDSGLTSSASGRPSRKRKQVTVITDEDEQYNSSSRQKQSCLFRPCAGCLRMEPFDSSKDGLINVPVGFTPLQVLVTSPCEWMNLDISEFLIVIRNLWVGLLDRDNEGRNCLQIAITADTNDTSSSFRCNNIIEHIIGAVQILQKNERLSPGENVLQQLLESVDCLGNTVLHTACQNSHLDVVKILIPLLEARSEKYSSLPASTYLGLINSNEFTAIDILIESAMKIVETLELQHYELISILKGGLRYNHDEYIFHRDLALKLPGMVDYDSGEELTQSRVRRWTLFEEFEGASVRNLVKLKEIVECLIVAWNKENKDQEGRGINVEDIFDTELILKC